MISNKKTKTIISILKRMYPGAKCSLTYSNPLQLLIATILSAQCTDERVNKTTPALFKRFKSAKDFAAVDITQIEEIIKSCGFYRSKAKSISETCKRLAADYKGIVPNKIEDLLKFRGVARKTANVVLGNVFHDPQGVVVDTHMIRIANRLGLTKNKDPIKIEQDLNKIIPKKEWTMFSHYVIAHGRAVCKAQNPKCDVCPLKKYCEYYKKIYYR